MTKHRRFTSDQHLNDKIRELVKNGWVYTHGGKHAKLVSPKGAPLFFGLTISDGRGPLNVLAHIRRIEREEQS